ncbi:hypothetical protein [Amycolatopsis sp. H20-H5]|uniref:hypothetical protein n=1 Tax=Amycolatopsis sp. H20-H5 TaxID=3046309 RepID=UPI002DBCA70E|nr:hypothetical protein [Amycolatopsis sp. H20-H5]MEC3981252.1 hypothetical protein [Amycolatopsis sp. H20-H5]
MTGLAERRADSGRRSTPFTGPESTPTPAAPSPRSSSSWTKVPPNEWPMMIGGLSSARMTRS